MRRRFAHQSGDQIGLFGAHMADRDIRLAPHQIADIVGGNHLDLQPGRLRTDAAQRLGQHIGRHHVAGGDPDAPLDGLRLARSCQRHPLRCRPHGARMLQQVGPRLGKHQRPPDPLEQQDAQILLQRRDLAAERRLCQVQSPRCRRQRSRLGGFQKGADVVPVQPGQIVHAFLYKQTANFGNY